LESVRKEKGKTTPSTASSSQISGKSRNKARTRTYIDSPEFLQGPLRQLQEDTASEIYQRTMARIGQLHLAQSSSSSVDDQDSDELDDVDGGIDFDVLNRENQAGKSSRHGMYYDGFNATPDILAKSNRREEDEYVAEISGKETGNWPMRNDAVAPLSHSVLRKNITARRSLGRPKDRESIGTTSVPLNQLLSRKVKLRERDLEYDKEVMGRSNSPRDSRVSTTATKQDKTHAQTLAQTPKTPPISPPKFPDVTHVPDVTRKHFPMDNSDPALISRLTQLWMQKKDIEEELRNVEHETDDANAMALTKQYSDINSLMFMLLQPTRVYQSQSIPPEELQSKTNHVVSSSNYRVPASTRTPKWNFQGDSFLIYLQTSDGTVPWTAWEHMPVSLLVPASISVLAMYGKNVQPQDILLNFDDEILDTSFGRLSDYNIGDEDVIMVVVVATIPRGMRLWTREGCTI
jgi:hypothetical protein